MMSFSTAHLINNYCGHRSHYLLLLRVAKITLLSTCYACSVCASKFTWFLIVRSML